MKKEDVQERLKSYLSNIILIWAALFFYRTNRYYVSWLKPETQEALWWMAAAYTLFGLIFVVIFSSRKEESRGLVLIRTLRRFFKEVYAYIHNFSSRPDHPAPKIEPHEKTTLLFALVKIFYLPIMLNFFFDNLYYFQLNISKLQTFSTDSFILLFNAVLYPLLLASLLTIDTAYFIFGYSIESSKLKNVVRSVEPTFFGWMVALICYPPFNSFSDNYVGWYANDYVFFWSKEITFVMRILLILSYGIYVWATLALGAKSSNLTNRGTVSRGPYSIVRHPAYISKNLAWCLTVIPPLFAATLTEGIIIILTTAAWVSIYYMRAITEERHLIKDPEYQEYCKKVKYRFIPGLY